MKLFRYTKLDSFLVLYALLAFLAPITIAYFVNSIYVWLLLLPFQIVFNVIVMNTSMHHHSHVAIFNHRWVNRLYEIFVSMATSIPFQLWQWYHLTHHRFNNDKPKDGVVKDPLSFYRYGQNGERENFYKYCFVGLYRDMRGISQHDETCSTPYQNLHPKQMRTENIFILLYFVLLGCVSFPYMLFNILVVLLSFVANNANSYGEHYLATDWSNFRKDSVGSYGKWYNRLCFNSGYHQEHHVKPSLHWTLWPTITFSLPEDRTKINGLYIFNAPLKKDLNEIFKI